MAHKHKMTERPQDHSHAKKLLPCTSLPDRQHGTPSHPWEACLKSSGKYHEKLPFFLRSFAIYLICRSCHPKLSSADVKLPTVLPSNRVSPGQWHAALDSMEHGQPWTRLLRRSPGWRQKKPTLGKAQPSENHRLQLSRTIPA